MIMFSHQRPRHVGFIMIIYVISVNGLAVNSSDPGSLFHVKSNTSWIDVFGLVYNIIGTLTFAFTIHAIFFDKTLLRHVVEILNHLRHLRKRDTELELRRVAGTVSVSSTPPQDHYNIDISSPVAHGSIDLAVVEASTSITNE